jgi:hypothetical protein
LHSLVTCPSGKQAVVLHSGQIEPQEL